MDRDYCPIGICTLADSEQKGLIVALVVAPILVLACIVAALHIHSAGCRRKAVQDILIDPIILCTMRDPVTLVQSGHTFDRESLCQWLLINPTRCPFTNVDYGVKLQYGDNIRIRQLLTLYYGEDAFQRYDDATFKLRYDALWNEEVYQNVAAFLYGMNKEKIQWTALQQTLMNDYQEDSIIIGFKALLLHPGFFISSQLQKDENKALREWRRAEELGLTVLIDSGNPWAHWLRGMFMDIVEDETETALRFFTLAADQGHALSQFSLGVVYEQDYRDYDRAEYYYEQAAAQGHALAQYSLAMLYDETDIHIMWPYLVQAANQGQAEANYYLGTLYVDSDIVPQDYEVARQYFERAVHQGHITAQADLDFVLMRLFTEMRIRELRAITRNRI